MTFNRTFSALAVTVVATAMLGMLTLNMVASAVVGVVFVIG